LSGCSFFRLIFRCLTGNGWRHVINLSTFYNSLSRIAQGPQARMFTALSLVRKLTKLH
jgi:hypothetical protein